MEPSSLDRLLEAEKAAQDRIEAARVRAKTMATKARERAQAEKEEALYSFRERRKSSLREAEIKADEEAERIKRDGIELANGLSGRVKSRIPDAVESVLLLYRD